ncbi:MAG: hypothetical protein JXL97_04375 [Bacteroidales bacterium]|nr:hypothetical protein [Bacteroidales bacterium]
MKKYLFKILIFAFLLIITFLSVVLVSSEIVRKRHFENWETESNLLILKPNTHYDIMFIGNSHARNFSRHNNHKRVENILGKKFLNIGQTAARCGANEYSFYLNYCYSRNISADLIIVTVSTPMLYAEYNNIASNTFEEEPLNIKFLSQYIKFNSENKWQRIFYYIKSKVEKSWLTKKPYSLDAKTDSLLEIDSAAIEKGFKIAFIDGFDSTTFNNNAKKIENLIELAQKNNAEIIFITTPTLFGEWPNHAELEKLMKIFEQKYGVKYYDFSNEIKNPNLYYDHHHLNTKGIVFFTENYLKPIIDK